VTPAGGPSPLGSEHPFAPARRGLTIGLLLAVSLTALASLALVTIAPRIPAELGGLELYGWLFSGYLLASLLGTVWGGAAADRRGLRRPFATGLALVAVGLAVAGVAPSMGWVIGARALQGFGSGVVTTCVYVAVTRFYPDAQRARLLALLSSAWVTPALVGPALAGVVAGALGWRWVFLGLLPTVAVVAALTLPRFVPVRGAPGGASRLPAALAVVAGLGVALAALSAASSAGGSELAWPLLGLAAGGGAVAAAGLGRLLPPGTLRLARGLGALVAARGGFFAAFIGVEAFLALMLDELHGLPPAATGAVIACGAVSWSLGAWWQARHDAVAARRSERGARVVHGTLLLGVGLAAQGVALAWAGGGVEVVAVAVAGWLVAGFGIGVAHATSSVWAFALAEGDGIESGRVSSALQLGDNVGAALATGVGGAALAWATVLVAGPDGVGAGDPSAALRAGVAAAFGVAGAAWVFSYAAARRAVRAG
jgi:MFS family permease